MRDHFRLFTSRSVAALVGISQSISHTEPNASLGSPHRCCPAGPARREGSVGHGGAERGVKKGVGWLGRQQSRGLGTPGGRSRAMRSSSIGGLAAAWGLVAPAPDPGGFSPGEEVTPLGTGDCRGSLRSFRFFGFGVETSHRISVNVICERVFCQQRGQRCVETRHTQSVTEISANIGIPCFMETRPKSGNMKLLVQANKWPSVEWYLGMAWELCGPRLRL